MRFLKPLTLLLMAISTGSAALTFTGCGDLLSPDSGRSEAIAEPADGTDSTEPVNPSA